MGRRLLEKQRVSETRQQKQEQKQEEQKREQNGVQVENESGKARELEIVQMVVKLDEKVGARQVNLEFEQEEH